MTVTKQQQLEWLAMNYDEWPFSDGFVFMSHSRPMEFASRSGIRITRYEWQQERDKMRKQQDSSWHERGELPPVECGCWYIPDGKPVFIAAKHCAIDAVIFSSAPGAGELYYGYRDEFRPRRTEREKEIDEMVKAITDDRIAPLYVQNIAAKLYNAGYRKEKTK